jgi:putative pyruvate formate lyase activating enzyme
MYPYTMDEVGLLLKCTLCPRSCRVNRYTGKLGYCNSNSGFNISSICIHKGEEPVISGEKGICNIFFSHCNLQCVYCQNYHISRNIGSIVNQEMQFDDVIKQVCEVLDETENIVGFVSPSHQVPQMITIIRELHKTGRQPIIVYNTNGYDKVETLRMLEGLVDVYLPDIKYADPFLAKEYSDAPNYPEIAFLALKEMVRQKGTSLILNDRGVAESGIIIRHLVLPGHVDQSIQVLRNIENRFSTDLHFSIMSQYDPTYNVTSHPVLYRTITQHEYNQVVDVFHELGFYRGWIQDMESHSEFRPDFHRDRPFE